MSMTAVDFRFLEEWRLADGRSLDALSRRRPVLLICLRHGGCPFCRQVLAEVAARRAELEAAGIAIVLVHLMSDEEAAVLFARFRLDDLPRIADPQGRLYDALGAGRGSLWQIMGPAAWWHGTWAVLGGHRPGRPRGDVFRLPGSFLVLDGQVLPAAQSQGTHARPDFDYVLTEVRSASLSSSAGGKE